MVSIKYIKGLDFDNIEEYFNYIVESDINGQVQQSKELYNKLSVPQKEAFRTWFLTFYHYDAADEGVKVETELQKFLNKLKL